MKMTNEELAAAKDRADWKVLWTEVQTRADFSIEQVAKGATKEKEDSYDGDITNTGREAAFIAMKDWEPLENALDTHVKMRVQGAISDYRRREQTGGIGSERVTRDGNAADHMSMAEEVGFDEEGGDMPTLMDELTYADTDNVPAGYGSPELEAARDTVDESVAYYLHGLTEEDAALARSVMMGDSSALEYAQEIGVHHSTIQYRLVQIRNKFRNRAKMSFVLSKGIADWKGLKSHYPVRYRLPQFWSDAEGMFTANPIWSEATGRVWNDWAWQPLLTDIPNTTALRKFERDAQKRAA